jgi:hypothetical protein
MKVWVSGQYRKEAESCVKIRSLYYAVGWVGASLSPIEGEGEGQSKAGSNASNWLNRFCTSAMHNFQFSAVLFRSVRSPLWAAVTQGLRGPQHTELFVTRVLLHVLQLPFHPL